MTVMSVWAGEVTGGERRWVMRLRVTLAVVVLGLIIATVTLARQQTGDPPKRGQPQADLETIKRLREEVAQCRADLEVQEVEQEAQKAVLLVILKDVQLAEWKGIQQAEESLAKRIAAGDKDAVDRVRKRQEIQAINLQNEFKRQAARIHMKKFELADLEKQLAHTR